MQALTTHVIDARPERVFAAFSDFANAAGNVSGIHSIEILTEGPIGEGTRFRETRILFKKKATEELEITSFDPPRSYTVAAYSCGAQFSSTFRFEPEGNDATRVTMEFSSKPMTFFARLMAPLGKLMMKSMKKCVDQDILDLKTKLEGDASAA